MSKKGTKSIVSIGFIDLLTGFLCATAALMIIIKYGAEQGGEVAGGPDDYILYSTSVEFLNPGDQQRWNLEDLMIQLIIKTPEDQWLESAIDERGMELTRGGFLDFGDTRFYGLGPSVKNNRSNRHYYHVYGISQVNDGDEWELGVRYYSNRKVEDEGVQMDANELSDLLSREFLVRHKLQHVGLAEDDPENPTIIEKTDTLTFGADSSLPVLVYKEN